MRFAKVGPTLLTKGIAMKTTSKAEQAAVIAHRHDFRIPEELSRDQQYAWLAQKLNRQSPNAVMTRHFRLELLCGWYGGYRFDGKSGPRKCANKTRAERSAVIFRAFDTLHELGYRIEDPLNLSAKHVEALVSHWADVQKLAPKTFQCYRSALSVFCDWTGKRNVVKPTNEYKKEGRQLQCSSVALRDKSWEGKGIDVAKLIGEIFAESPVTGAQLLAMQAFGLRPREALMFRPVTCVHGREIHVIQGGKSGRTRVVILETEEQMAAAAWLKAFVKDRGVDHLGWNEKTLQSAYDRMYNSFKKFGLTLNNLNITAYGLRHQFVHEILARHGILAPIKGGLPGQVSPEHQAAVFEKASIALGHARPQITAAYAGSFLKPIPAKPSAVGPATGYGTQPANVNFVFVASPSKPSTKD